MIKLQLTINRLRLRGLYSDHRLRRFLLYAAGTHELCIPTDKELYTH